MLLRWRLGGGSYRTLESDASPVFDARGEMLRLQGVDRGVTERIAAETELKRRRDHLEELVTARTAELALRKASDPKQQDYLGKVATASRQLLGLIDDILDISRIEAERLSLEVAALVLLGDARRLGQILLNFAGNAVKFTEQGRIALRVKLAEAGRGEILLRFEVEDIRGGISDADLRRLFSVFEQADASTTRRHGGTGLGLAISLRLAALMGGTAGVASVLGQGSTFWFTARLTRAS